jgi:hypothetical protein
MGSYRYAEAARARQDHIIGMLALETHGHLLKRARQPALPHSRRHPVLSLTRVISLRLSPASHRAPSTANALALLGGS